MESPNLRYLDDLAGTDLAFRGQMLQIIRSELEQERKAYAFALEHKNWKEAGDWVHKMKHKIGILGLKAGYRLTQRYEEGLRREDPALSDGFEAILEQMEAYLKSISL